MVLYFAYGSNIHPRRLETRVGEVESLGVDSVEGYSLTFDKRGADRSAKCNLRIRRGGRAFGACYRLRPDQWDLLEEFEPGYRASELALGSGRSARLFLAEADLVDEPPFSWYRDIVVCGMEYFDLPPAYREAARAVTAIEDHHPERAATMASELEIMRRMKSRREGSLVSYL